MRSPTPAPPDQEHTWAQWLRMVLEDLFVARRSCVRSPHRRRGVYAIEPIDGATIKRVLDDHGRTPMPLPVRQQVPC